MDNGNWRLPNRLYYVMFNVCFFFNWKIYSDKTTLYYFQWIYLFTPHLLTLNGNSVPTTSCYIFVDSSTEIKKTNGSIESLTVMVKWEHVFICFWMHVITKNHLWCFFYIYGARVYIHMNCCSLQYIKSFYETHLRQYDTSVGFTLHYFQDREKYQYNSILRI